MKKKVLLSWSSGKDCAWALHELRQDPLLEVVGLMTTVNQELNRVAVHAVRLELLQQQAASIGLPLHLLTIPYPCSNAVYQEVMHGFVLESKVKGIAYFAFGDLFLEDIRRYREAQFQGRGITPLFPIWGRATQALSRQMVAAGLKAAITCIDPKVLPASFAGRKYDTAFLDDLPPDIDPCGENGEFHSFVFDGPMFKKPIAINVAEVTHRDGFIYADLLPA